MPATNIDVRESHVARRVIDSIRTGILLFDSTTSDDIGSDNASALTALASKADVAVPAILNTGSGAVLDRITPPSPFNAANDTTTGRAFFEVKRATAIEIKGILAGADNTQAIARLWLWTIRMSRFGGKAYLVPEPVCDIEIQAGTKAFTGITLGKYADTITVTNATAPSDLAVESFSRSAQDAAILRVHPRGAAFLEIEGTLLGVSGVAATTFNWLAARC